MKRIAVLAVVAVVALAAVIGWAEGFKATVKGTFTGGTGVYTNTDGAPFGLVGAFLSGAMAGSNAWIRIVDGTTTNLLAHGSNVTETLSWQDGDAPIKIPNGAKVRFTTTVTTNAATMKWMLYRIDRGY